MITNDVSISSSTHRMIFFDSHTGISNISKHRISRVLRNSVSLSLIILAKSNERESNLSEKKIKQTDDK